MGLANLTTKEIKQAKSMIKMLSVFGVTEEDLRNISKLKDLEQKNKQLEEEITELKKMLTDREKIKRQSESNELSPIEEALKVYRKEEVEFNPYAR